MIDRLNLWLRRVPAWPIYIVGVLYPAWLLYQGVTGALGVDPVKAMEHGIGKAGLQLLVLTLAVTPLRRLFGLNLMKFRRAFGLLSFFYIALHLLVWFVLDVQIASQVWADILKRPYITIGMVGFLLMLPLALTSNNWSLRHLGRRWSSLHKLTYVIAVLGGVHYVMLVKGLQIEPLLYLLIIFLLLSLRRFSGRRRLRTA